MHEENEVVQLHLDDIIPNRFQPREVFDEKALKELAVSIKEHGVIQPIIVRNIGNKYEIIAGERRYKASALAGLTKIPAIVRNLDDKESSKVALLENLQRKNLNPIEEARTYQKILELDQMTQEELAKTMGKSQGAVANKLRLLSLSEAVQDAVLKEQISERHARSLLSIQDKEEQDKMLKQVIDQKMTVRELENIISPEKKEQPEKENYNFMNPPVENPSIMPFQTPPASQSDSGAIDYSTPPKFIDYGVEEENQEEDTSIASATNTPDLAALRQSAQDINKEEKPTADLDSLLHVSTPDTKEPQAETFKFFGPLEETKPEEVSQENNTHSISDEYFKVPDVLPQSNQNNIIPPMDPFQIPQVANSIQESIKQESPLSKDEAHYSMQQAIEEVRALIDKLEKSGVKVEKDEMDFDKNYQIVIKLLKDEKVE